LRQPILRLRAGRKQEKLTANLNKKLLMSEILEPELEPKNILLIDLENCPNQINQLQTLLMQYQQIIICYAKSEAKVPIDWLVPLSAVLQEDKLKIFKMPNMGKNAADFGISFYAGILTQQVPQGAKFAIVSNDKDLDHVISLLKNQGFLAQRIGTKAEEKKTTPPPPATELDLSLKAYCNHLITHSKTRPAKESTLLTSIMGQLKINLKQATEVMQKLIEQKAISITAKKVTYYDERITALAKE
jgi:hypothetical protein